MATGTVKWFSNSKHYGFITPDAGGQDVFLHRSVLAASDRAALTDGARVSFDLTQDGERAIAANLALLETQAGGRGWSSGAGARRPQIGDEQVE